MYSSNNESNTITDHIKFLLQQPENRLGFILTKPLKLGKIRNNVKINRNY